MQNKPKDHLTEDERGLIKLYRQLDAKGQHHVILAAQAVKATADRQRNPFAL